RRRERGWLELPFGDQSAIDLVGRDVEKRRGQEGEILPPVHPGFADERHRLAERFNDGSEKEVAAELYEIGNLRGLGDNEGAFPDRVQKRCRSFYRLRSTSGSDDELARGSGIRSAEHRRRHEKLSGFRMRRLELLRQGGTYRA